MSGSLNAWRPLTFGGLELTAYEGRNRAFPSSLLSGYNFGVRLQGVRQTVYRKRRFTSGPGTFLAYTPGIALSAKPVSGELWQHIDMTFAPALLESLLDIDAGKLEEASLQGTVNAELNSELFSRFVESHASFRDGAPRLEQETKLLAWLKPLFADGLTKEQKNSREPGAVKVVKNYLDAHATQDVSLDRLADLAGLSKHYLLRVFKHEVGVTPYKYQSGLRLSRAKSLLRQGVSPAQVAFEVGLYDQSALNRLFKRHMFLTPGQYQRAVLGDDAERRSE